MQPAEADGSFRRGLGDGTVALVGVAIFWVTLCTTVLGHPIFVTNDSLSNYAHVWFISDYIWAGHGLPLHMPVLAHGEAFAFPYSFLPWMGASLMRPVFGDWAVTLTLVAGAVGLIWAVFFALPELRGRWAAAVVLANPVLVEALLLGQLPFTWSMFFLLWSVGLWRRRLFPWAVPPAVAALATHPALAIPISGVLLVAALGFRVAGLREVRAYALALVLSLPAVYFVLASPVVTHASLFTLAANLVGTVVVRLPVVVIPLFAAWLAVRRPAVLPWLFVVVLSFNFVLIPLRGTAYAWGAPFRQPDTKLMTFLNSPRFEPGSVYRLLRAGDGKVGMYKLLLRDGSLDSEFFPESIERRSWPSHSDYFAFLGSRKIDHVVIFTSYDQRFRTNEHELLRSLVVSGCAELEVTGRDFEVFGILRGPVNQSDCRPAD